jgi:ATP-dependent exoDNAse (exonuclease V) alpha subunit
MSFSWPLRMPRGASRGGQRDLDETFELAVGMKVMMTYNLHTEIDLANGARGEIIEIVLDHNEPDIPGTRGEVRLKYPLAYVLVKFNVDENKTTGLAAVKLPGLERGVVPVIPHVYKQTLVLGGKRTTVERQQLPLAAAYAFTDYRSQGQTIPKLFVDLARPPTGRLSPFNTYVACSRARGRSGICFIRDVDWRQFSSHPSEYLRKEDERLAGLNEETKRNWV